MQRELLLNGPIVVAFYVYSDFAQVMSVGCTSTGACMSVAPPAAGMHARVFTESLMTSDDL